MKNSQPHNSGQDRNPPSGRYRFYGQIPLDPNEGVHPEMQDPGEGGGTAPHSPDALIKMQAPPAKTGRLDDSGGAEELTIKVKKALSLLKMLDLSLAEDKQVALAIVRHLESYHDEVVEDLVERSESKRSHVAAWAVDADRLMLCRIFLEGIEL